MFSSLSRPQGRLGVSRSLCTQPGAKSWGSPSPQVCMLHKLQVILLSSPKHTPRLWAHLRSELHLQAGREAICLMLWNPDEIKSGQSTFIYLMYFWAGQPPCQRSPFSRPRLRVYRRRNSSWSAERPAPGLMRARGGPHFPSPQEHTVPSPSLPHPTSQSGAQETSLIHQAELAVRIPLFRGRAGL